MPDITVIVLTYNEEIHIKRSLTNVLDWAKYVYVLDSGSSDKTCQIAQSLGARVFFRKFDNYANQREYAIKDLPVVTDWIFFLDADEYLTNELMNEITERIKCPDFDGYYVKYRLVFMNKWLKHGGCNSNWILRLFKRNKAGLSRGMNEHIKIDGSVGYLKNEFIHHDLKGLSLWLQKHIKYADFEVDQLLISDKNGLDTFANFFGSQAQRKRWIRQKIWNKLIPPLIRPFLFFFYRYFLLVGFMDGLPGFCYHFMQGLWYRILIDIKYIERVREYKRG